MSFSKAQIERARRRVVKAYEAQGLPELAEGMPWNLPFELAADVMRAAKTSSDRFVAELRNGN